MQAIVTGASGFVGRALCAALPPGHHALSFGSADWERALRSAPLAGATIFHLAARVHDPRDRDESAFERDNVVKARALAEEAARQRARRIVVLSTIKVNGEETRARAFMPGDVPAPGDAYGRSKLGGERAVAEAASAGGVEWVVVRSPLVLGPGAKANLASLLRLADTPWPLPFAGIANRRSFVHVADLSRLLLACAAHASAPGRVFLAAHPATFSTPAIVGALRRALGRPERLYALPAAMLELVASVAGQSERMRRLTRSLEVDASAAREHLGWTATVGLEEAVAQMAHDWRSRKL
jgi:nucleoside-diphosphate-sugar epimerase